MIAFTKMHGIGNDFVMVNGFGLDHDRIDWPHLARQTCDRSFGVGADGLILAMPGNADVPFRMRMWNPDGSESEMCGNGIRCFAEFLHQEGLTVDDRIPVLTGAGQLELQRLPGSQVRVNMGRARLLRGEIGMTGPEDETFVNQPVESFSPALQGTAVSMGNPHLVMFVESIASVPLENWGPRLEHHPLFPQRVNVHFVEAVSPHHLRQLTWERGAGRTLACGTGACACAVAAILNQKAQSPVEIDLPGGRLTIEVDADLQVWMTGPAATVFTGSWRIHDHQSASPSLAMNR
ncbi:MAG TPA: diaminopimelate epimerase [Fimbriimonadaceae bacterium]|nr:diaminopimelate epimerase [Fimbriimonadaceae bacterium]HRJ32965.1 diaminopimelate epimerase [Fimbriimonadaceae bacterium]